MVEQIAPWPFQSDSVSEYAWTTGAFSTVEIDKIIELGKADQLEKATVLGNDESARDSHIGWLRPQADTDWLFRRMTDIIAEVNAHHFGFDLYGLIEGFQFTEYKAPAGHYTYHTDRASGGLVRKLSLTMQLSEPGEYEGGDLEFLFGKDPVTATREKGAITFFPSWALHRVTPVTEGTRYSLVAWITGPNFK
jgi:PKHD-type hydroxylase